MILHEPVIPEGMRRCEVPVPGANVGSPAWRCMGLREEHGTPIEIAAVAVVEAIIREDWDFDDEDPEGVMMALHGLGRLVRPDKFLAIEFES